MAEKSLDELLQGAYSANKRMGYSAAVLDIQEVIGQHMNEHMAVIQNSRARSRERREAVGAHTALYKLSLAATRIQEAWLKELETDAS